MRLLQLATGPDELIDLHPHVTVVTGLDAERRRELAAAVEGLARGTASGPEGLLEAHGVLFHLSSEMLALIDLDATDLQPVVRAGDLPTRRGLSPRAQELLDKEQALDLLGGRWSAAVEADAHARAALAGALLALEDGRGAVAASHADETRRADARAALAHSVAQAAEHRRQIDLTLEAHRPRLMEATAHRKEVDVATSAPREAKQATAARTADIAAALDAAARARGGFSDLEVDAARARVRQVEAAIDAELAIEAQDRDRAPSGLSIEAIAVRQAELGERREVVERTLVLFEPTAMADVERALAEAQADAAPELVASPAALALAEQLDAIDIELGGLPDGDEPSSRMIDTRSRLDQAREGLLEAEQSVRNPVLDRDVVERLESAHADLLDAIDKVDSRFGGARAKRRVDELRSVEDSILDQLGLTSYSAYMIGHSLFHVDPKKEQVLDDARQEMAEAEDAWRLLQEQIEAELLRAARLDRRRALCEQAQVLLGRPVGASGAAEALRSLRVEGTALANRVGPLRESLDAGGLAVANEDLDLDDLTAMAEVWLDEARQAAEREAAVRQELEAVDAEQADLAIALAGQGVVTVAPPMVDPEVDRQERLTTARLVLEAAEAGLRAHDAAEQDMQSLTAALADAEEEERIAAAAAVAAEDAFAAAVAAEEPPVAEQRRIEDALAVAARAEADANEAARALAEEAMAPAPDLGLEDLVQSHARWVSEAATTVAALASLEAERDAAEREIDARRALIGDDDDGAEVAIGEEVEWYLLARLAAQRSVSLAGSLPLLLDDALHGLDGPELQHVLDRLERVADAVQVIVVSEDPTVAAWAHLAGAGRAAVVRPGAP